MYNLSAEICEQADVVPAFVPVNLATADNDGIWVSMMNCPYLVAVLVAGAGTAGDDPIFTLRQAQDGSGTGDKALNFTTIQEKIGALGSVGTWTEVLQASANTYVNTSSAETDKTIMVEVKPGMLDLSDNFTHVQLQVPQTAATQRGAGFYVLPDLRHGTESQQSNITETETTTTTTTTAGPTTTSSATTTAGP